MQLSVLGSGSRGNAITLSAGGVTILIDAGFGIRSLTRRARAASVDLDTIGAVVLTHEHGDHARGALKVAERAGCPIYASPGTLRCLEAGAAIPTVPLDGRPTIVGPFVISSCRISHDAAEPLALMVADGRSGKRVGIAYDLGHVGDGVRRLLARCSCLIVEANHDDGLLRVGPYPPSVQARIAGARGHLSNTAAARLIDSLFHPGLTTVVLAHLSDRCNRDGLARAAVTPVLTRRGFRGTLLVAEQERPLAGIALGAPPQLTLWDGG